MNQEEIEKVVEEAIKKELPKILGRSLPQIREYLIKEII